MENSRVCKLVIQVLLVVMAAIVCAQCQHEEKGKEPGGGKLPRPEAVAFWTYINKTDPYRNWSLYPGTKGLYASLRRGLTPAKNPHGAYLKLHGNGVAIEAAGEAREKPMPEGAILIMENYGKDKKSLLSITAMYKLKGYNPEGGDWFWAVFGLEGEIRDSGKVQSCIECHLLQKRQDWRFAGTSPHHHH